MVASEVLSYLSSWHVESSHGMNDFADNLTSTYTLLLLLVFATLVTMKTYVFRPIACYSSSRMDGPGMESFVENYCWVRGTLPLTLNEMDEKFPGSDKAWDEMAAKGQIQYYQWVPLILGLLALGCYFPRLLWRIFYQNRSGTDYQHILDLAAEAQKQGSVAERNRSVQQIVYIILDVLGKNRDFRDDKASRCRRRCFSLLSFGFLSKRFGSWLVCAYLLVKLLSIGFCVLALAFLHHSLGFAADANYTLFGLQVVYDLVSGRTWQNTRVFPRVAFCRVPIRHIGKLNKLVVQCAMPANMLNEVVFVFLWFWLLLVLFVAVVSLLRWFPRCLFFQKRKDFIRKFLHFSEQAREAPALAVRVFVENYLLHDGVFLLRMMAYCVGSRITTDVVLALWTTFQAIDDWADLHRPYRRTPVKAPADQRSPGHFKVLPMARGGNIRQRRPSPGCGSEEMEMRPPPPFSDHFIHPSAPMEPRERKGREAEREEKVAMEDRQRRRTLSSSSSLGCKPPLPPPPHAMLNMEEEEAQCLKSDVSYPSLSTSNNCS